MQNNDINDFIILTELIYKNQYKSGYDTDWTTVVKKCPIMVRISDIIAAEINPKSYNYHEYYLNSIKLRTDSSITYRYVEEDPKAVYEAISNISSSL